MGFYGLEHKHQSDFIQEVQDWQKFGLIIIELISGKTHVSNQNELIYALEDTRKDFRFLAIQIYDYIYKLVHHQLTEDKFISNMKNIVLEIIFQEKLNVFKDEMAPSEAPGIYLPDIVSQIKKSSNNTENYEKTAQCLNSTYISKNNGNLPILNIFFTTCILLVILIILIKLVFITNTLLFNFVIFYKKSKKI